MCQLYLNKTGRKKPRTIGRNKEHWKWWIQNKAKTKTKLYLFFWRYIRLRSSSVLCYTILFNVMFYNILHFKLSLCSGGCRDHLDWSRIFTKSSQGTPCFPRGQPRPWCTLIMIFYVQRLGAPLSLEHMFNFKRASHRHSLSTRGFMTFWCCHFDMAVLIQGFRDILSWLKRQIIKHTAILCN